MFATNKSSFIRVSKFIQISKFTMAMVRDYHLQISFVHILKNIKKFSDGTQWMSWRRNNSYIVSHDIVYAIYVKYNTIESAAFRFDL